MRTRLDKLLATGGLMVLVLQALSTHQSTIALFIIMFGFAANQAGVWGLTRLLFPERREYLALRLEVDEFIGLVRRLNAAVVDGDGTGAEYTRKDMLTAVDRICDAAGVVEQEVPAQAKAAARKAGEGPATKPAGMPAGN